MCINIDVVCAGKRNVGDQIVEKVVYAAGTGIGVGTGNG